MYLQTNTNNALPSGGDVINEHFAKHYKASLRTAYRILHSKEDSEDAVQTAYCAALRRFDDFRGESSFKTWITRIVINCSLMQLRERRARPQLALDDIHPALASHATSPEALCYQAELRAAHKAAASKLPKGLRDIYIESAISGVAFPAVVHHLGLTPVAAKARLFRARRKVEHSLHSAIHGRVA